MPENTISISLSQDTMGRLLDEHYRLYAWKGTRVAARGGMPLVWFATDQFSAATTISWDARCVAYTSNTPLAAGSKVRLLSEAMVDLGETLRIESADGKGQVLSEGTPGAIAIRNATSGLFTCGYSQGVSGELNPICALPLYGQTVSVVMPVEQVLLSFAQQELAAGTMLTRMNAPGFLIDLADAPGGERTVQFDFENGWSSGGYAWGKAIAPNANLVPLLLDNSAVTYVERLLGT